MGNGRGALAVGWSVEGLQGLGVAGGHTGVVYFWTCGEPAGDSRAVLNFAVHCGVPRLCICSRPSLARPVLV